MTTTATAPRPTAGSADELASDLGRLTAQLIDAHRPDTVVIAGSVVLAGEAIALSEEEDWKSGWRA